MELVPYFTAEQIEVLLHGAALLAGGVAFWFGLRQYSEAQAWKRHEFVASEVRLFNSDPLARNAMQMIDWGTRTIELFPSHPDYNARYALVTRPVLHIALITHDRVGRPYTATEAAIRDCFDAFFGGLERFEQFMQADLVKSSEFQPYLAYWIRSICEETNPELRALLDEYVRFYRFESVAPLFQRYGKVFGQGLRPEASKAHDMQKRYEEIVSSESTSNGTT
jgi:hypothetical protein